MGITVEIRSESTYKRLFRRDILQDLVDRVCAGEGVHDGELSILFCDDPAIQDLNRDYRKKDMPTDVLSFEQDGPAEGIRVLGDIVISLETVANRFPRDARAQRNEVLLLVCHGLLHLLGYDHGSKRKESAMAHKQAEYLGWPIESAWPTPI